MQYLTAVSLLALAVVDAQRAGFGSFITTTSSTKAVTTTTFPNARAGFPPTRAITTTTTVKQTTSSSSSKTTSTSKKTTSSSSSKTTSSSKTSSSSTSTTSIKTTSIPVKPTSSPVKPVTTSTRAMTTSTPVKPTTTSIPVKPTTTSTPLKPTTSSTPLKMTTSAVPKPATTSTSTTLQKMTTTSSAAACTSTLAAYGCLPLTNQAYFVQKMLDQHNTYRMRHNAPNMTWNPDLVPTALANAQNNADKNVFVHTSNDPYGENIAYQYGYNNPEYLGFLWYDEERKYNFTTGGFSDATGHFTQLVWLSSTQLGCAYVQAKNALANNGWYYLSCEYNEPGNYYGEYQKSVLPPNSQPYPTQPPQWL